MLRNSWVTRWETKGAQGIKGTGRTFTERERRQGQLGTKQQEMATTPSARPEGGSPQSLLRSGSSCSRRGCQGNKTSGARPGQAVPQASTAGIAHARVSP